jgi:hypothetical protein
MALRSSEWLLNLVRRWQRAVWHLLRQRVLVYALLLAGTGVIWLWSTTEKLGWPREAAGLTLPLLAAALSTRILAYLHLTHFRRSMLANRVQVWINWYFPTKAHSLSVISGIVGGLAGGALSGPLVAYAYIRTAIKEWGKEVFGPGCEGGLHYLGLLHCSRFYWILFCTTYAGALLGGPLLFAYIEHAKSRCRAITASPS